MKITEVLIEKIHLGDRIRKDAGDIEGLAESIRKHGLLEPIGIDEYYHLIFGARRLEACADILKWKTIPCVTLQLDSLLVGEHQENEIRKNFAPSERVAIGKALEEELSKRRGRPAKNVDNCPPLPEGKTRDIAAKSAGFDSGKTYERAKKVTASGSQKLVEAMDKGKVSIAAASKIASLPKSDQERVVAMKKGDIIREAKRIAEQKADREATERRRRDVYLFGGLFNAVQFIAKFAEDPKETWAGLSRVSAFTFFEDLQLALTFLTRLRKEHPNEVQRPESVTRKAQ
jgi:ParB family chromosome partitioning protein